MELSNLDEIITYVELLPEHIINTLREYTDESIYKELNYKMRMSESLNQVEREIVNNIKFAFNNVPLLNNPITVYRGITKPYDPSLISYTSASLKRSEAIGFTTRECCLLKILLPAGSSILPIMTISNIQHEKEILINDTGSYLITKITENAYGPKEYDVVYVPGHSVDITISGKLDDVKPVEVKSKLNVDLCVERLLLFVIDEDEAIDEINPFVELLGLEEAIIDAANQINCNSEEIIRKTIEKYNELKSL